MLRHREPFCSPSRARIAAATLLLAGPAASCAPSAPAPQGDAIACALDGAETMVRDCTLAHRGGQAIVYHPDGGFRRLGIEGNQVVALDGADPATSEMLAAGEVEVTIAGDRYRIPRDAFAR